MIRRQQLVRPSYANGYARSAAESANPELWNGLLLFVDWTLGNVGVTPRDLSPYRRTGIFNGGSWSGGAWYAGAGQYCTVSDDGIPFGNAPRSFLVWGKNPSGSRYRDAFYYGTTGMCQSVFVSVSNEVADNRFFISNYGDRCTGGPDWGDGAYHAGVATYDGSIWRLYVDGASVSPLETSNPYMTTNTVSNGIAYIGGDPYGQWWGGWLKNVGVWGRALQPSEAELISADPHALTRLRTRKVFASSVAAAPSSSKVVTSRRNLCRPSFVNGYARSAAESANPDLWGGLAFAWDAALGNTGAVARDISGYGDHGTITGATWGNGELGGHLAFGGSGTCATFPVAWSGGAITVAFWHYITADETGSIFALRQDDGTRIQCHCPYSGYIYWDYGGHGPATRLSCPYGEFGVWKHIVLTNAGETIASGTGLRNKEIWIDGVRIATSDLSGNITGDGTLTLGNFGSFYTQARLRNFLIYSQILPDSQICLLASDRFALTRLRTRKVFASSTTSTPPTNYGPIRRRRFVILGT